ncbi:ionotropic receptor 75a-like [Wyeomyia smithii]|uniref:ionotropic receptor 75a-like n=1 Tax=Wyeomyia smithii TaxID=174621 RepID=UPI0024681BCF|nr:ionotropic receptor 75a-like [Wyeomyia smithii]
MLLVILLSFVASTVSLLHPQLLRDFVLKEHLNAVIAFHCNWWNLYELHRMLAFESPVAVQSFLLSSESFYSTHDRVMYTRNNRFGVVADLGCSESEHLLKFCSEKFYFNASYRWFLISATKGLDSATKLINVLNVNADTRITLVFPTSDADVSGSYQLYDIFGTVQRRGGKIHMVPVTAWTADAGTNWTTTSYNTRKNLGGVRLKSVISTLEAPRNVTLEEYLSSLDAPTIFQLILVSNSTSGVIGPLKNNLVDFSSTPLVLEANRLSAYEQTVELAEGKYATMFIHPKHRRSGNAILKPFQGLVWVSIVILLFMLSTILTVVLIRGRRIESIYNGRLLLTGCEIFAQQGYSGPKSFCSSRVVIITAILFCLIILQFYIASIYSSLLVDPPKNTRTLEQLLTSELHYSIEENNHNRGYFNTTTKAVDLQLYRQKILPDPFGFTNFSTGIALLQSGKYAFHCDTAFGYAFIKKTFSTQEICDLQELKLSASRWFHIVVPKGSPLKELFRVSLKHLQEIGIVHYYRRIFYSERPECLMQNPTYLQVDLREIVGLYWFLLAGIMLSAILLMVEIMHEKWRILLEGKQTLATYPAWLD